jgi:quinol monooxygenase YgiN
MLLRLVRFTLDQRSSAQAQTLATELIAAIKQQPGCLSATFFGGGSDGDCGMSVLWDSQAHADAAYALMNPKLQALLAGKVAAPADIRNFPVLAN